MVNGPAAGLVPRRPSRRADFQVRRRREVGLGSPTYAADRDGGAPAPALHKTLLALILLATVLCTGCRTPHTRLTIRGGPSLDSLFSSLAAAYQQRHPNTTVVCDFTCPPCVLYKRAGAISDFDLFASLGQFELDQLRQYGKIDFGAATAIGTTTLSLVTSAHAPEQLHSIADLHRGKLRRIGVGNPDEVGVGYYARQALSKAGLWDELKSRFVYSQSGCELLKWLGLGKEIDAAIVFSVCSDEDRASIREVIEFPRALIPPVPLLLAAPRTAAHAAEAQRFIDFARSDAARPILLQRKVGPVDKIVRAASSRELSPPQAWLPAAPSSDCELTNGDRRESGFGPHLPGWKPCSTLLALAAGSRSYTPERPLVGTL